MAAAAALRDAKKAKKKEPMSVGESFSFLAKSPHIGFGSLAASTPYLGLILLGIVGCWIYAARDLDCRFNDLQAEQAAEALAEKKADDDAEGATGSA
jgi:ATP/ADP translocase